VRRTGDLTQEEKDERRHLAAKKHYKNNRPQILEKLKDKRKTIRGIVGVAEKLGRFCAVSKVQRQRVRGKVDDLTSVLQQLYGPSSDFTLDNFLDRESPNDPPTFATFPRLVVYFFPFHSLPDVSDAIHGSKTALEVLPTPNHYRELSRKIHPDKNSVYSKYQTLLNDSFELWAPILRDSSLKNEPAPPNDENELEQYQAKGDKYLALSQMFYEYSAAYNAATILFMPTSGSLEGLHGTLASAEEAGKLVHASLDDEDDGMQDIENGIDEAIEQSKLAEQFTKSKSRGRHASRDLDEGSGNESEDPGDDEPSDEEEPPPRRTKRKRVGRREGV